MCDRMRIDGMNSLAKILSTEDFNERSKLISENRDQLKLGKIQSRKYFEAYAQLRNSVTSSFENKRGDAQAVALIKKYEGR